MLSQVNRGTRSVLWHIRVIGRIRPHLDNATCARMVQALAISKLDYANSLLAGGPATVCDAQATDGAEYCGPLGLQESAMDSLHLGAQTATLAPSTLLYGAQARYPGRLRTQHRVCSGVPKGPPPEDGTKILTQICQSGQLDTPGPTKNTGDRAFAVCAPRLWNSLPANLRHSDSQSKLKTHMFSRHFID